MIGAVGLILLVVAHNGVVMTLVGIGTVSTVAAILVADREVGRLAQLLDFLVLKQATGGQRQQQGNEQQSPPPRARQRAWTGEVAGPWR